MLELSIIPSCCYVNAVARYFQPVEAPAPKSPSPSREVPTSTFVETPPNQQQQEEPPQKKQRPQQQPTEAVQSPEDNRVSSMSDETSIAEEEPTVVHEFADMLRFGILSRGNSIMIGVVFLLYCFSCRRCLCYFAPPSFQIQKDEIKKMTTAELREFPLVRNNSTRCDLQLISAHGVLKRAHVDRSER